MAHLEDQEAVTDKMADANALDAFDAIFGDEDAEPDPDTDLDTDVEGDDEGEAAEADDEDEEPGEPAIPAPVSFNADERENFASLTPEQQRSVAATEARRNSDVQRITTEAAEAKRNARAEAEAQFVDIQRQYAAELEFYASNFSPQEPDFGLIATNPQAYAAQLAGYKQAVAQRQHMEQQAAAAQHNADAYEQQQKARWESEQQAILSREVPEWNDPAKRSVLLESILTIGRDLGFSNEALSNVDASEIKALRTIAMDRAKAEKWDKLQSEKMAAIRAQKGKPAPITARPGTAQPRGSSQRRAFSDASARLSKSGSDRDALDAFEALGM